MTLEWENYEFTSVYNFIPLNFATTKRTPEKFLSVIFFLNFLSDLVELRILKLYPSAFSCFIILKYFCPKLQKNDENLAKTIIANSEMERQN